MTWNRNARLIGIAAIAFGLLPSWKYEGGAVRTVAQRDFLLAHADAMPGRSDFTLGWSASPMVRWVRVSSLAEDRGNVTVERSAGVELGWLTWSSAALVLGAALLVAARSKRPFVNGVIPPEDAPAGASRAGEQ